MQTHTHKHTLTDYSTLVLRPRTARLITKRTFSTIGLPKIMVMVRSLHNSLIKMVLFIGPLTCHKWSNCIHRTPVPFHPATNDLAERTIQTSKQGMKKLSGPMNLNFLVSCSTKEKLLILAKFIFSRIDVWITIKFLTWI